ncbi:phospholipase D-like domain-containing protein [Geodermatophilus sp. URMC 62]|uniref:phospholipase D-like domain-containing protein n=1 Tax=Geodermatophilus sp. URMC 62 TaxID=3423414 RepID=UPI00406BF9FD
MDGVEYFSQLHAGLSAAGPGDSVFLSGLQMDADTDLTGRAAGEPGHQAIADLLAEKAADGVDVRVLLTGAVFSGSLPWPRIGPFRDNVFTARAMRGWLPAERPEVLAPPLRDRVLLDWSGAGIGSNHQKLVLLHVGGQLSAFVGGIDLVSSRYDATPHDRLRSEGQRWGWHDGAARITGPAAARVWENYRLRWQETATLPRRYMYLPPASLVVLNPPLHPMQVPPAPATPPRSAEGNAVQVLRSFSPWKIDEWFGLNRVRWTTLPHGGVQEVYRTLATAIAGARRYVYLEDQYFHEMPGGRRRLELYEPLRQAAARGVKVILVGSGRKDPADGGVDQLKRTVTRDLRHKVIRRLPPAQRSNVVMHRVQHLTVHTKLVLVDDAFACVGSANFFSRSMAGTDSELSCALVTDGTAVRDLRVRLWAEHLRTPVPAHLRPALEDLDLALGIWRSQWLPPGADPETWQRAGRPVGFAPAEQVLVPVTPYHRSEETS